MDVAVNVDDAGRLELLRLPCSLAVQPEVEGVVRGEREEIVGDRIVVRERHRRSNRNRQDMRHEDLVAGGRTVYLASSKVGRVPRRYRGKDVFDWLTRMKYYDVLKDTVTDPNELTVTTPLVSGVGIRGHTVSLQSLHKQGVQILGRLKNIENDTIIFDTNAGEHVRCGDDFSENIKARIDDYILQSGIPADESEDNDPDQPDINASCAQLVSSVNCNDKNINTVIWTTGFTGDFSWIHLPVLTHDGEPIHHNGVSPVPGLYFIGFPWLRSRKSGILYGITDDAAFIVSEIMKYQS